MEFNQYYQDELAYLREMGAEFARYYPKLAPFLTTQGSDPDVERLLEGFAFIAGRLRQKLDDELPELTEGVFSLIWPHFMRPVPATSILEFKPITGAVIERKRVPKGVEIDSVPVDGLRCRFQTCSDVDVFPIRIEEVEVSTLGAGSSLLITLAALGDCDLSTLSLSKLRLYLHGDVATTYGIYLWMLRRVNSITLSTTDQPRVQEKKLPPSAVSAAGFSQLESVIPYPDNVSSSYRLIQEFFALPQKFQFIDISLGDVLREIGAKQSVTIRVNFNKPLDAQIRITKESFRLFCVPIINLFKRDSDPVRHSAEKTEYIVRPMGEEPQNYDIFSIDSVQGWMQGSNVRRDYTPFVSFEHHLQYADETPYAFYRLRRQPAVVGRGVDTYISFVDANAKKFAVEREVVSMQMTCSNRHLPDRLKEGDINIATGTTPEFISFSNIAPVMRSIPPPIDKGLHWNLISTMSIHYSSLMELGALRNVLSSYNFASFYNRQAARVHELRMEGLEQSTVQPVTLIIKGSAVRGVRIKIKVNSAKFSCEGEMFAMMNVVNQFFGLFATVNSFIQLWVEDTDKGELYQWAPMNGLQTLL